MRGKISFSPVAPCAKTDGQMQAFLDAQALKEKHPFGKKTKKSLLIAVRECGVCAKNMLRGWWRKRMLMRFAEDFLDNDPFSEKALILRVRF